MNNFLLAIDFSAGIVAGTGYFLCLSWNVRRFVEGGRTTATIALMAGRIVVLGGLLTLASHAGAMPLLVMALGVFIARYGVMRALREVSS